MTTDQTDPDQPDRSDEERPGAYAGTDRPFGFWLKLVDRRLSEEMETLFAADGITRRDWRMLNLLAGEARDERLAEGLRAKPHSLHRLAERGWITGAPPVLTDAGREARDRLEGQVSALRERVAGAVPAEDFATMLRSLEAIARELGWDESHPMPRGRRGGRRHGFGQWRGAGMRHGFGRGHGFEGAEAAQPFGSHGFHPHAGFGPRPGFGPQHGRQDVHVHVHLHDDDRHDGRGRRHRGRPHPEA
ncbi:hypothetical protein EV187_3334 [Agromyces ramosus]|uniref:DNA-binding MarR family transcriptional regulator n=1 Tax=Agromyces ramosus TaxID=33879 RepID=A0A4Q7MAZ7_9MICO|nr:MarR family winged helix-turn-helix transcriptional regulator [Agromyces ramosus]RZS63429.1 hypothetical protein EV187_3334 [Agromyces ramosus]